jgi:hypothetical protein
MEKPPRQTGVLQKEKNLQQVCTPHHALVGSRLYLDEMVQKSVKSGTVPIHGNKGTTTSSMLKPVPIIHGNKGTTTSSMLKQGQG